MSKHGAASFLAIGIGFLWIAGVLAVDSLTVSRVIDGDSLLLSNGSQVRLIGIDAPEFKDQSRNQQMPVGWVSRLIAIAVSRKSQPILLVDMLPAARFV